MSNETTQRADAAPAADDAIDPLEALLASVHRIEHGIGGIYELAIGLGERPAPTPTVRVREDDRAAIDALRAQLAGARLDGGEIATVRVGELARLLSILDRVRGEL